jgi:hypothetical protein
LTFWRNFNVGEAIDILQTLVLVYVVIRFERAVRIAASTLQEVLGTLRANTARIDRLERRRDDDTR